ncbi:hypothetical protein [Clostridium sp.]|uniref:hypothetical protein n=1 Tax=Clostridium sp. TaxID=1506 RepID=UPI002FC96B99
MAKMKINLGVKYNNLVAVDNENVIDIEKNDNLLIRTTIMNVLKRGKKKETVNNNDIYDKIKSQIKSSYVK